MQLYAWESHKGLEPSEGSELGDFDFATIDQRQYDHQHDGGSVSIATGIIGHCHYRHFKDKTYSPHCAKTLLEGRHPAITKIRWQNHRSSIASQ